MLILFPFPFLSFQSHYNYFIFPMHTLLNSSGFLRSVRINGLWLVYNAANMENEFLVFGEHLGNVTSCTIITTIRYDPKNFLREERRGRDPHCFKTCYAIKNIAHLLRSGVSISRNQTLWFFFVWKMPNEKGKSLPFDMSHLFPSSFIINVVSQLLCCSYHAVDNAL